MSVRDLSSVNSSASDFMKLRPIEGNSVEMKVFGPAMMSSLKEIIDGANHYIHLSVMLFFNDIAGNEVANWLAAASGRGVKVRVMADSEATAAGYFGGSTAVATEEEANFGIIAAKLKAAGIQVIATQHESYWTWEWPRMRKKLVEKGVPEEFIAMQEQIQSRMKLKFNVVNHRKFLVADGETSLIGSFNVGDQYLYWNQPVGNYPVSFKQWYDGFMVIRGPFAGELNRLFASRWMVSPQGDVFDYEKHYRKKEKYGNARCTLLASQPGNPVNTIRKALFEMLEKPASDLLIENAYISDKEFFERLSALTPQEAKRVVIINPYGSKGNDYPRSKESVRCSFRKAAELGVRFFVYAHGNYMTHMKIALDVAGRRIWHGSYNINNRSALHDLEANVLVEDAKAALEVEALLRANMEVSKEITDAGEWYQYPFLHPVNCGIFAKIFDYFA